MFRGLFICPDADEYAQFNIIISISYRFIRNPSMKNGRPLRFKSRVKRILFDFFVADSKSQDNVIQLRDSEV
jgi:hypothetical protein